MSARVADLLNRAADRIERDGWHRGAYYPGWDVDGDYQTTEEIGACIRDGHLPCCALGALYAEGARSYDEEIGEALGMVSYDIPDWNDKPSQRKGRVIARLRKAAEKELAQQ